MKNLKAVFLTIGLVLFFGAAITAQTTLTSIDGNRVDVEGQNGKVVILAIGASWLPLSAKQAEFTNALAKKYAGKNVVVYYVATDSSSSKSRNYASNAELEKFATDHALKVTVLRDPDGALTLKRYGVDQVPSFVILNKQGDRAFEPFGGIDPKFDITVPISRSVDRIL